ncbi:MAG: hypothetical protein JXR44_06345 [Thiotrichales bacterium]|nr:hypothetical protein [Thiotrichales bacterium]
MTDPLSISPALSASSLEKFTQAQQLAEQFAAELEQHPDSLETGREQSASTKPRTSIKSAVKPMRYQPKLSAYEKAFWRNRLWLKPFLALSLILWWPFMLGLFTQSFWFNLGAITLLAFLEYRLVQLWSHALNTLQPPLWQRFFILFLLRRGLIVLALLLLYGALQPLDWPLLSGFLLLVGLYWGLQLFLYWQRKAFQQRQIDHFSGGKP